MRDILEYFQETISPKSSTNPALLNPNYLVSEHEDFKLKIQQMTKRLLGATNFLKSWSDILQMQPVSKNGLGEGINESLGLRTARINEVWDSFASSTRYK